MEDVDGRTSLAKVQEYNSSKDVFSGLFSQIKVLSHKKPDATMNPLKVRSINRVLENLSKVLCDEPEEKYLDLLDDSDLPQVSDAVLVMSQYETALAAYAGRYRRTEIGGDSYWAVEDDA